MWHIVPPRSDSALLLRSAQLGVLTLAVVMVAVAVGIFNLSGTLPVYPDNAMQVCFEVSLLGFLVSWMVSADIRGPLGWDHNVSV